MTYLLRYERMILKFYNHKINEFKMSFKIKDLCLLFNI